jgi:chaperone BCS1
MLDTILHTIQSNQTLLAAIGLGGAGIITFWVKDLPKAIFQLCKRELTTSLTVTSQNVTFYDILKWIGDNYKDKNFRELKLSNGKWGEESTAVLSVGYGVHFIRYKLYWFMLRLIKEEANQTMHDKETLILTKLGRNKVPFLKFIDTVSTSTNNTKKTKIYKFDEDWSFVKEQDKRDLKTVFIDKDIKAQLLDGLRDFVNKEQWYHNHGIPYQLGILLYGPPGTGKTSLIRAIASYLNYPLYILPTFRMLKIEKAFETIQEKCIIVLEDIDCQTYTHTRQEIKTNEDSSHQLITKKSDPFASVGLAEILNALDGICSVGGRILIATTNHIEKLDQALIRSGRFDLKIKIDFVTNDILKEFLNMHFSKIEIDLDKLKIKDNITVAYLQEHILKRKTLEEIIKDIT